MLKMILLPILLSYFKMQAALYHMINNILDPIIVKIFLKKPSAFISYIILLNNLLD